MLSESAFLFVAVGLGAVMMMRRHVAFRLRTDFWGGTAAILVLPVVGMQIVWPDAPELYFALTMVPAFIVVQFALFLATLREADKLRLLRREVSRWRLLTGTPPKGYHMARVTSVLQERHYSSKAIALSATVAGAVIVYAIIFFGWNGLVGLAAFFWAFMALYQFSFSPDNQ